MPLYSEAFKSRWLKACKLNMPANEYLRNVILQDAHNYVATYFNHLFGYVNFHLAESGHLFAKITDKDKFAKVNKINENKVPEIFLIKSLEEQNKRIKHLREESITQLPEFEGIISRLPIQAIFANPLNAGAMPTPNSGSAIVLNEGIVNVPIYIQKACEAIHSTHEKWEEAFSWHINHSYNFHKKQGLNISIEAIKKQWLELYPPPPQDEIEFKHSEAFLFALEIFNLKTPRIDIINRRSDFDNRAKRPLVLGQLEDDGDTGDSMTVEIIEPFIFFHELAHILLGHTEVLRSWYATKPSGLTDFEKRIEISHRMEFQADGFAVDILLHFKKEWPLSFIAGGILKLFELLAFCEINYDSLDEISRIKVFKKLGIKDVDNNYFRMLQVRDRTHPSSIERLGRIWSMLVAHQPQIDYNKAKWWNSLTTEERVIHMATTGKGDADYSDHTLPSQQEICKMTVDFINFTCNCAIDRISNDNDENSILHSIPNEEYPYTPRYSMA